MAAAFKWLLITLTLTMSQTGDAAKKVFACETFEECNKTTTQIIQHFGFPVEEHKVETEDGYILGLQRIPGGINDQSDKNEKPAVLIFHGLLSSSTYYVVNGPNVSLGFYLAECGFDVWLGNFRANIYSRNNTRYDPSEPEFWHFNFDDHALKDIPASIDYIVNEKNATNPKLYFISYSMSTGAILATLSTFPKYNDIISKTVMMAPSVFTNGVPFLFPFLLEMEKFVFLRTFRPTQAIFPTSESFAEALADGFCDNLPTMMTCPAIQLNFKDSKFVDQSRTPIYFSMYPAGSSSYVLIQIFQIMQDGQFHMYTFNDTTLHKNLTRGAAYNLKNVRTPLILFSSTADEFVSPDEVQYIRDSVTNGVIEGDYVSNDFVHEDFVYAPAAKTAVYDVILKHLAPDGTCASKS